MQVMNNSMPMALLIHSLLSEEELLLPKSDNTKLKAHGISINDLVNLSIDFLPFALLLLT